MIRINECNFLSKNNVCSHTIIFTENYMSETNSEKILFSSCSIHFYSSGIFTLYVLLRRQHSGSVPALLLPSPHNQHSLNQISLIRNLFLIQQIDRYKCRNTFFLHRYSVENIRSIHCSTPMSDDNKLCIFRQFMQILRIPVYI